MARILAALLGLFLSATCLAGEADYRPGGARFAKAWHAFYDLGDHEPELDDPLILAGPAMAPYICVAVSHKDMKLRRYAISALGYIRDPSALACLEPILKDSQELDYFRGDALQSIFMIDNALGESLAREFGTDNSYLEFTAGLIRRREPRLFSTGLGEP
jgi:hypothetical protein